MAINDDETEADYLLIALTKDCVSSGRSTRFYRFPCSASVWINFRDIFSVAQNLLL